MTKPIYLDYAATTPVDPRIANKMQACLLSDDMFGNPASRHFYGQKAQVAIAQARDQVAHSIHATPSEIIFTSGATESDNLALKGAMRLYARKGNHLVTMATEHKAVLDSCQYLEKQGVRVTYLTPLPDGRVDLDALQASLCPETVLVSIMHVNNETGVIQPIEAIAALTAARGILLHVDAAQSLGKLPIDVQQVPIDLLSLSAHKAYGPKGVGALYLRQKPRVRVEPLIHGGGHELGMRSGTLATHQIIGMGETCALAVQSMAEETTRIAHLQQRLLSGLAVIPNIVVNGDLQYQVPHILNLRFKGMLADALLTLLPTVAASTASACQGSGAEGSYVLRAMGLTEEEVKSSVRLSLGRFTTQDDIDQVVRMVTALFDAA